MAVVDRLKAVRIKANLIADRQIGWMEIEADVQDGIATLTGDVTGEAERERAEELAYQIDGIHEVVNEIKVRPITCEEMLVGQLTNARLGYGVVEDAAGDILLGLSDQFAPSGPGLPATEQFPGGLTDARVEQDVREKLALRHDLDTSNLRFESINQIVHLRGEVRTSKDLDRLLDIVINTCGVMGVSSDVTVRKDDTGTP